MVNVTVLIICIHHYFAVFRC